MVICRHDPIIEEIYKLLPLAVYLFYSRRATSLSLGDYVLLGAAPGIGFQFMEELSRRLVQSNYGVSFLGGKTLHWELFDWFPGYFEESFIPTMMNVTHPVHSAMIALGIGLAFVSPNASLAGPMLFRRSCCSGLS